jgi:hypothetical protein
MMDIQELVVPRSIPKIFDMGVVVVAKAPLARDVPRRLFNPLIIGYQWITNPRTITNDITLGHIDTSE